MLNQTHVEARERVLVAADRLFTERGYQAVTLRDIAQEIGIRHASLYYHFPQGKEELFVEVTARRMRLYRAGLEQAIQEGGTGSADWQGKLRAAANWMLAQPTMYLGRMLQSDMRLISAEAAEKLRGIVFESLLQPLTALFNDALAEQPAKRNRSATLAGMFLSLIEGIDNLPPHYVQGAKEDLVDEVLDLLINGLHGLHGLHGLQT